MHPQPLLLAHICDLLEGVVGPEDGGPRRGVHVQGLLALVLHLLDGSAKGLPLHDALRVRGHRHDGVQPEAEEERAFVDRVVALETQVNEVRINCFFGIWVRKIKCNLG